MLSSQQLQSLALQLAEQKKSLEQTLHINDHFGLSESLRDSVGEISTYDNHPADTATELYERGKDIALNENTENLLQETNEALKALQDGAYGRCKVCGADIPFERLEAIPHTLTCTEHSLHQQVSEDRPIEEEVLPPFGKRHTEETVGFDAEDSWQSVAKWGNSDTPSDFFDPKEHYDQMYINSDEHIGYVEDIENCIGNDINGKNIAVYPTSELEQLEDLLDEEGIMTSFGDLKGYEQEPYVEDDE
ncbi:TraR/DksA C4-type zinc finger protein [Bacillus testis]|uniref:TraR/DksA C4-type zinc finger protein n=1 Tax=Bacillus testis TaxID=1622072 RepID=UPI00067ECDA5|nr:TraR/DksA C4-type zinc finger protein [Bacillus testis]